MGFGEPTGAMENFEVEPPGSGLFTRNASSPPGVGASVAVAVNCVGETNCVVNTVSPCLSCDPGTNPVPMTVMVCAPYTSGLGTKL